MTILVRAVLLPVLCLMFVPVAEAAHSFRVAVFLDRDVVGASPYGQDIRAAVETAQERAATLFFHHVGRAVIFFAGGDVDIPPELAEGVALSGARTISWLHGKRSMVDVDALFLITDKFVSHNGVWGDGLTRNDSAVIRYGDIRQAANVILHELGHQCGAGHSTDPASIMHERSYGGTHFGEWIEIIRARCGHSRAPEAALLR